MPKKIVITEEQNKKLLENIVDETYKALMEGENPCWGGYQQIGMKKKNGKEVPNCVPKESVNEVGDYPAGAANDPDAPYNEPETDAISNVNTEGAELVFYERNGFALIKYQGELYYFDLMNYGEGDFAQYSSRAVDPHTGDMELGSYSVEPEDIVSLFVDEFPIEYNGNSGEAAMHSGDKIVKPDNEMLTDLIDIYPEIREKL